MKSNELINQLQQQLNNILVQAEELSNLKNEELNWREHNNSWSILECLAHLNLYGDFYLNEFRLKIQSAKKQKTIEFNPGLLGNYFAESMLPKPKLNKMKTFKDKNPLGSKLDRQSIEVFKSQLAEMLKILEAARQTDLNHVKVSTSISSFIKLKLGDALRFYINHIIRHFAQIENIKKAYIQK